MVELQIVVLAVAGSSPVGHPTSFKSKNTLKSALIKAILASEQFLLHAQLNAVSAIFLSCFVLQDRQKNSNRGLS